MLALPKINWIASLPGAAAPYLHFQLLHILQGNHSVRSQDDVGVVCVRSRCPCDSHMNLG